MTYLGALGRKEEPTTKAGCIARLESIHASHYLKARKGENPERDKALLKSIQEAAREYVRKLFDPKHQVKKLYLRAEQMNALFHEPPDVA